MPNAPASFSGVVMIRRMADHYVVEFVDRFLVDQVKVDRFAGDLENITQRGGVPKIVVNFSGVKHMSSSVLGALIATHNACQREGGELRIACVSKTLMEVFKIAHLHKMMRFYKTVEHAEDRF